MGELWSSTELLRGRELGHIRRERLLHTLFRLQWIRLWPGVAIHGWHRTCLLPTPRSLDLGMVNCGRPPLWESTPRRRSVHRFELFTWWCYCIIWAQTGMLSQK